MTQDLLTRKEIEELKALNVASVGPELTRMRETEFECEYRYRATARIILPRAIATIEELIEAAYPFANDDKSQTLTEVMQARKLSILLESLK